MSVSVDNLYVIQILYIYGLVQYLYDLDGALFSNLSGNKVRFAHFIIIIFQV